MEPIRLNGIFWSTNHATNVVGVTVRRVEVRVVANEYGHSQLNVGGVEHALLFELFGKLGTTLGEDALERGSYLKLGLLAERHELVEGLLTEDVMVDIGHDRSLAEEPLMLYNAQIDNLCSLYILL